MITILRRDGFTLVSSAESHQKWRKLHHGKQVIVPYHRGRILPLGTVRAIVDGSGIQLSKWFE